MILDAQPRDSEGADQTVVAKETDPLQLEFLHELRGTMRKKEHADADRKALGGMRRSVLSLSRVPGLESVGKIIRERVQHYFDANPDAVDHAHRIVQSGDPEASLPAAHVESVRAILAECVGASDVRPVDTWGLPVMRSRRLTKGVEESSRRSR